MRTIIEQLNAFPLAGLMLVVALGFTLGRLSFRGFSLGPAGGTLLVALGVGSWGFDIRALYSPQASLTLGGLGFALFIYSVGFEAGPRFFGSLAGGRGWRLVFVGVTVNVLAFGLALLLGRLLVLDRGAVAGLLSGALTSAPTYAAAAEAAGNPPSLAVAFALTYPLGLAGVVLLVQSVPRWMGDDLEQAVVATAPTRRGAPVLTRAFRVEGSEVAGRHLAELDLTNRTGCTITRLHRGPEVLVPDARTVLVEGDHVRVRGRLDEILAFGRLVGPEVFDEELQHRLGSKCRILVTARAAHGRSLAELAIPQRHRCLITLVERGGVNVEPSGELVLERCDVVQAAGEPTAIRGLAREFGRFESPAHETDIAVYAGGIFMGLLIGRLPLPGLGVDARIGSAVGLLLVGVLLGRFRHVGPFRADVPLAARQLVRDLGILLFVAETGLVAGAAGLEEARADLLPLLAGAVLLSVLTVVGSVFVARRLLRLGPVEAWGAVCGGMTSSAALLALRRAADSDEPALSYAAAYAVASVVVTLAGPLIVLLA